MIMRLLRTAGLLVSAALALAACGEEDVILPGERVDLRDGLSSAPPGDATEATLGAQPIALPAQTVTQDWTHKGGSVQRSSPHPALSTQLTRVWSANIGRGNSRRHRITAAPVVANGRIFTLDSRAQVTATATNGGTIWQTDLTPGSDRADDASGGGLAYANGRLYVTTGFGTLSALDATNGAEVWTQRLDAPVTGAPAVAGELVYAVSRDNTAWAIDISNGRIRWELPGTPNLTGRLGAAGPAVDDRLAIFPFSSGEVVAAFRQGGVRLWSSAVSGQRLGRAYTAVTDIAADPVIAGGVVYAGNISGRTVALETANGTRRWSAGFGAIGPVQVAGGSVFLISDQNELVRLDAATGQTIWTTAHELYPRHRRTPQCGQIDPVQPACRPETRAGRRPARRDPRPARGRGAAGPCASPSSTPPGLRMPPTTACRAACAA
jgi:outer membrane protein assembly factor BamB